jgi:hypothetical protein
MAGLVLFVADPPTTFRNLIGSQQNICRSSMVYEWFLRTVRPLLATPLRSPFQVYPLHQDLGFVAM